MQFKCNPNIACAYPHTSYSAGSAMATTQVLTSEVKPPAAMSIVSQKVRPFGIPEAPTVYPSELEFADPHAYIRSLVPLGDQYGIVKVVPPATWDPPFCLDRKHFSFQCRRQHVGSMGVLTRAAQDWLRRLSRFHRLQGSIIDLSPSIDGNNIDYYQLRQIVLSMGGYEAVHKSESWSAVGYQILGRADPLAMQRLVNLYILVVLPFEIYSAEVVSTLPSVELNDPRDKNDDSSDDEYDDDQSDEEDNDSELANHRIPRATGKCSCGSMKSHRCGDCKKSFHFSCTELALGLPEPAPLSAKLSVQPWYCPRCIAQPSTFLFDNGLEYTLDEFEKMAKDFKKKYLREHFPKGRAQTQAAVEEFCETEFWKHVNDVHSKLEVEYGAEIRCDEEGSGFPMKYRDRTKSEYAHHPWNLNNLPKIDQSLFRHLRSPISGVTVPWAYVGMSFSAFCWHTEDHYCYSLNYQHLGEPKTWYGIPAYAAADFEETSRKLIPESFAKHPDLLAQRSSLVPPQVLQANRVPIFVADQRPGEFIITFPNAYHAGFNQGFNLNEAVNYVAADWIPLGFEALRNYRKTRHEPTFSHEELLVRAVRYEKNPEMLEKIRGFMKESIVKEKRLRSLVRRDPKLSKVPKYSISLRVLEHSLDTPGYRCTVCHCLPFFSRFMVRKLTRTYYCLECALTRKNDEMLHEKLNLELCFSDNDLNDLCKPQKHHKELDIENP